MNSTIFLYTITTIAYVGVTQLSIRCVIGKLFSKVVDAGEKLIKDEEHKENNELRKEVSNLRTVKDKKELLGFITIVISLIEVIIFSFLLIFLKKEYGQDTFEIVSSFSKFFGVWVVVKTIGNFGQWSGPNLGRASFYVFLIGTLLNIASAILLGLAFVV